MTCTTTQLTRTGRPAASLALLLVLFCCSGATCSRAFRSPFASLGPPAPDVLAPGATLDQVLAAVNQNATRIQNIQTNNASITVPGMTSLPLLRGNIAAQRPGRLRLQASTSLSGPEVDLGSNDELFWFWVRRNEPPALYFSHHSQFVGSAAQQVMPIEPAWLLDALGLAEFNLQDVHSQPVPHGNGTLEIRSTMQSRIGMLTKSTVVDARKAWVLEQHIYDAQGTLLASAIARSHQYYPTMQVSLPQEIDIRLPPAQLALTIELGTVQVNQPSLNPSLWQLPVLTGYPQIDLGTAPPNAVAAMGAPGSTDWTSGASPANFGIGPPSGSVQSAYGQVATPDQVLPPIGFTAPASMPASTAPPATPWVAPAAPSTLAPVQQQLPPGGVPL